MKITRRTLGYFSSILGIISIFYILSAYSYLLFHTIIEFFAILVAFAIFIIIWNTRHHSPPSNFFLILGISSLFIGILDFFHALSYNGMGIFLEYDANLPTQLWIAARYLQSLSLLLAVFSFNRKIRVRESFIAYSLITILTLVLIFARLFPDCYVGSLTAFKIYSEYIIVLILILVLFVLNKYKIKFEKIVYLHLTAAIIFTIMAELAFTFYVSVFGFSNFIGHIAKLISFILFYEAIVVTSLHNPFNTLFRNLRISQDYLKHERDQLAISNAMINDFNKSLNVVNSILRHDLLGNLHSINLSLEMLKSQENNEPVQFAQLAVEKGVKLILSMQNMEILLSEGKSLRKIDICEVIAQIREENLFESLEIDITCPSQCFIEADEALYSVIENLLKNIITHSGSDYASIEIKEVGDTCELRISDQGVGIPDDVKGKLFDVGFTSDETGTSIGLGLYIVKSVISRYKGSVEVLDNDPSGVVFLLRLKLSKT